MVTTHPPTHCGIGLYAEQNVAQLRSQGHVVDVVSPDGCGNVDYAWDLRGGTKILKLGELAPYYDRIVIQYTWAFFYSDVRLPEYRKDTLKTTLSFLYLFLRYRKIQVIAHEIPYLEGRIRKLFGWQWKFAHIVFHTRGERERLETHYGIRLQDSRVELREQHEVFQKFTSHTPASARSSLGIEGAETVFLCIGFIQRHKGFHRAIRAFIEAGLRDAQLFVVGSLRYVDEGTLAYLNELREQAAGHSNIHIVESFVSNEEFDSWIIASDWIVFPYTEIWSSAVLGRTKLLERPSIIAHVGGLPDQAGGRDIVFRNDEDLVQAFQAAGSQSLQPAPLNPVRSE
jgi:glycosyltransferase involved in cell wall biosynthesis